MDQAYVVEKLKGAMPDSLSGEGEHVGQKWVETSAEAAIEVLRFLQSDPELQFDCLMDLTAVDWLNQGMPERFCVVYNLFSFRNNLYFRVKAWVPEDEPSIESVSSLWKSAPWAEREVYDFYGIKFANHPGLKRIQLPEYYTGHPLLKDYPLRGMGEREHFPKYNPETGA